MYGEKHDLHHEFPEYESEIRHLKMNNNHFARFFKEYDEIDDELKAIYHSKDTVCIWVLRTRKDRNKFMDETIGMLKNDREMHFESFYKAKS
mgnify:CR=1 FL=1